MEQLNCLRCAYRHEDNGNCMAVGGFCTAVPAAHCRLLQEYLGTGLMPEEVNDAVLAAKLMAKAKVASVFGVAAERLLELAEADKAGRLMVLPCKPGDLLWTFSSYPVGQVCSFQVCSFTVTDIRTPNGRTMMNTSRCGVIDVLAVGKTVFLTREEAEKALEAALEAMK